MTANNEPPRGRGDFDALWVMGITAAFGYTAWTAAQPALAAAAERRHLAWADHDGHWHLTALAYIAIVAVVVALVAGSSVAGWLAAAQRWRRTMVGGIPRPPAVAAAILTGAGGWLAALIATGESRWGFGCAGAGAFVAGFAVFHLARRFQARWVATQVFRRACDDLLGFAQPALSQVRVGRWSADQPRAVRATTGPGWRGHATDFAALDRAASAAGWPQPFTWRTNIVAQVVIGECK